MRSHPRVQSPTRHGTRDPSLLWIKGGQVIDPANGSDKKTGNVYVVDGKIVSSLSESQRRTATVVEASELIVCPGFIDAHVHLREPGQPHKETIETGSWAAAAGGFTSVVCMPNTEPACDTIGTIQLICEMAARKAIVHVYPTGCLTVGRKGQQLAPLGSLKQAGVIAVSDDGNCIQSNELMRRAVEYASMFDLPVMDHCQDSALTEDAVINEGVTSLRLGLRGWPNMAEDSIVARNIILSLYSDAHIHMQHISSAYSVELIRRAKERGIPVTAEVTPHHLALTDTCLNDFDPRFKMNPPLRTEADRQALIGGILDGTLDIIATDHAPHADYEKDVEIDAAPFGVIGLETALPVLLDTLIIPKRCSLSHLISLLTHKPARLLHLPHKGTLTPGADADITIWDPHTKWTVSPKRLFSRSHNSPWLGQTLCGKVTTTIVSGHIIFDGQQVLTKT